MTTRRARSACGCLVLSLLACSDKEPPDGPPAIEISLAATVPAGSEVFRCKYVVLPEVDLDIVRFEHDYTDGSHHILLYPTSLSPAEATMFPADFDCTTVGELGQIGLAYGASEEPTGSQDFPEGVGLPLRGSQVVLLEAHYLNATDTALEATVSVRMFPSPEPIEVAAGNLFFYNFAIMIPPAPATASASMRCDIPEPINLQFASSHMHRRGIFYTSELISTGGERATLHETNDWESAEPATFEPALAIDGGSQIEFVCDFRNDLPTIVTEGDSAETNEMCMFIASYWPRQSDEVEGCVGGGSGPVFAGDATCLETLSCFETASGDVEVQTCLAATCEASGAALNAFLACVEVAGCTTDACVEQNCLAPYAACEASPCE